MNLIEQAKKQAAQAVLNAYHAAVQAGELPEAEVPAVAVEIPKDTKNGDYASSFAMQCARPLHMAPRKIAESITHTSHWMTATLKKFPSQARDF